MNTTNASWNTASFATSYCQLAASSILGWQKVNPDTPISEFSDQDAFRAITHLDRETEPSCDSFFDLQIFFKRLKVAQDEETLAGYQDILSMRLGSDRLYREASCQMLQGANDLFDTYYPKVKKRHEILSFRQDDEGARQIAADYLQEHPLLPDDGLRGDLIQLMQPQAHHHFQEAEKRKKKIVRRLASAFEGEFDFVGVNRDAENFKNGSASKVILNMKRENYEGRLVGFFSSDQARFVERVGLRLRVAGPIRIASLRNFSYVPLVQSLRSLDLSSNQMNDFEADVIAGSPFFSKLTSLNFVDNQIGDSVRALIKRRWPMADIQF